jgi:HSP20 family protein
MNENECDKGNAGLAGSVEKLRSELDSWLGYAVEKGEQAIESIGLKSTGPGPIVPRIDIAELVDAVQVDVDLAGVSPDSVEVTIVGNILTVAGERARQDYPEGHKLHLRERQAGKFSRSVPIPVSVNPDEVTAETKNGVLTVRLARFQNPDERRIKVNVVG